MLLNKKAFYILAFILGVIALLFFGRTAYPIITNTILQVFWFIFLSISVIFVGLGILVILGFRKEASRVLDLLLEGSLSIHETWDLLKQMILSFVEEFKAFILFVSPVIAYILGAFVYAGLMYLYKFVGVTYDITLITVILSVLLVAFVGLLNLTDNVIEAEDTWLRMFFRRVRGSFSDAFEVVIFAFFLTMESTNLFFLPEHLNIPLRSEVSNYDLMLRGASLDSMRITLTIVIIAITLEIIRNVLRLIAVATVYYRDMVLQDVSQKSHYTRLAIRKGFAETKDEIVKFIAFTTVLIAVFMGFPRLKLVAMAVASATSLLLDLFIVRRLTEIKGTDLVSKIVSKVLKL